MYLILLAKPRTSLSSRRSCPHWYLASKHPERFAAIVPIVGYGHPELMASIAAARLPVWCFAGGRDSSVRVKNFYAGLNRLEALGAPEPRFTIEEDMGHDVWARVYAGQDVYAWMLAHTKAPSGSYVATRNVRTAPELTTSSSIRRR